MQKRDLRIIVRVLLRGAFAWLMPERYWRPWRRLIIRCQHGLGLKRQQRARVPERLAQIESLIDRPLTQEESATLAYRGAAPAFDDTMRIFRSYSPLGWKPEITLRGAEHLDHALEQGLGVVLWVATFSGSRLVVKMALHQAGYEIHHLSRPGHGFSSTEFSIQYLNPMWVRVENRYLAERIRVTDETTVQAVKTIRKRLAANKIVSITDTHTAKQLLHKPFLNGYRPYATGAAHFAVSTGAALLPVFTIETGYRSFEVIIGESLYPKSDQQDAASTESLITDYSTALGRMVARHPHLWTLWPLAKRRDAAASGDAAAADT